MQLRPLQSMRCIMYDISVLTSIFNTPGTVSRSRCLVLLDLSSAFDTVDHRILFDRLQSDFGISGSALNQIESYFSNRTQRIYIDGVLSSNFNLVFGVPQGSCLGPLLFSLYASKLFKIVESHLPNPHWYADHTQLYIAFRPGNDLEKTADITTLESCIADISQWMQSDKLKLNSDKTECFLDWNATTTSESQ